MAFKFFLLSCLVAVASAGVLAPIAYAPVAHKIAVPVEQYAPAEYNFEYSVHDETTGDIKSQKEERHGDNVVGSYSLIEADGSRRIVEYTADDHSGFNAVVHREPGQHAVYKPIVKVAPVIAKIATPVVYAAPAYHGYSAPAHSYYH